MALLPAIASPMHGALVPIASQTVTGSSVATIAFNSIPQGYQDLRAVCYVRSTYSGADFFATNPNSNGSAICSFTHLFGNGSSASSDRGSSASFEWRDYVDARQTSGIFSSISVDILNYANTSTYKTAIGRNASDWNGGGFSHLTVNLFRSTSAITSLSFFGYNGNIAVGSQISLYGVRTVNQ